MLPLSLANVFAALTLFCAFLQIPQSRLAAMLKLGQASAFAVGGFVLWLAFSQKEWLLFVFCFLFFFLQTWALPRALSRKLVKPNASAKAKQAIPAFWSMLVGLLCVCVAALLCTLKIKIFFPAGVGMIAISFAVVLLGVWLVVVQTQIIGQMIGVLTFENGLALGLIDRFSQSWVVIVVLAVLLSVFAYLILAESFRHVEYDALAATQHADSGG